MDTEETMIEKDEKKPMKKAMRKQIKRLVKVYGDETALAMLTAFVDRETAGKQAVAGMKV